jgi:TfoX/Sxy family transcriptional regulator of competence genes
MAYDEKLALRIKALLDEGKVKYEEKKMFGGIAFMINDKMCVGISKEEIMLRVMDESYEQLLKKPFAKPMEFTGRVMKGFLFIEQKGFKTDAQLQGWIDHGLEFGKHGIVKSKPKKSIK